MTVQSDGLPNLSFFDFEVGYWQERHRPNFLMVHYNDLLRDLEGEVRRVAAFVGIAVDETALPSLVQAATFDQMRARDCVASIKRWGAHDSFGQALMARTDEVSAADDKTIVIRLNRPFALLPDALGHGGPNMCAIMPQRIAEADPLKQVTEMVGSGPFRFKADERVAGSLTVYERFEKYQPRQEGEPSYTAGPKIVHFDRVEWHVLPDAATKSAALQKGEMDWWEQPTADLLPLLRRNNISVWINGRAGVPFFIRANHLYPPFDKPAVRRALMGAVDQRQFMLAMFGEDTSLWTVPCGFFPPASPLASDAGMAALTDKRDYSAVKKALEVAGYQGEKLVLIVQAEVPVTKAQSDVAADMLMRVGMAVDYQAMDQGTFFQRRTVSKPPEQGGWNLFCSGFGGIDLLTPATHPLLRGNGKTAYPGWPDDPKIEELRDAWFNAEDMAAQKKIGVDIQLQAFQSVPYWPIGLGQLPMACRHDITGIVEGPPKFWNVRRT